MVYFLYEMSMISTKIKDSFLKEQNCNVAIHIVSKNISQCKTIFLTFTYLLRLIKTLQLLYRRVLGKDCLF